MSRPQPISMFLVASASAALHGAAGVVFTPILSFILLCWNGTAQIRDNIWIDDIMVFAVTVPMLAAAFGFVAGALAAAVHNVLAKSQRHRAVRISKPSEVQTASLSNVA